MYHQIKSEETKFNPVGSSISSSDFERQMNFISKKLNVISLANMVRKIRMDENENKTYIAITFDDGYEDNFKLGAPILEKYNVPATFFLTTDFIDNANLVPWWDILESLIVKANDKIVDEDGIRYNLFLLRDKVSFYKKNRNSILKNYANKEEIIDKIREKLSIMEIPSGNKFVRWDVLKSINSILFDFGAHTTSHSLLVLKNKDLLKREAAESKRIIELNLRRKVELFAFPYGGEVEMQDVKAEVINEAGYIGAVTTIFGSNNKSSDLLLLKRIRISPFSSRGFSFFNYLFFPDSIVFFKSLFKSIICRK